MNKNHKYLFLFFLCLNASLSIAQSIEGTWVGSIQGMPLVFEFKPAEMGYICKMQSPSQSKQFIPMDKVLIQGDQVNLELSQFQIKYQGQLKEDRITGTFTQGGASFPLNLEKKAFDEASFKRKQEPVAPFPYQVEEVTFKNEAAQGIKLSGTLTLPSGVKNPPVVVLISGSGPQNRNEEIANHKPFLVLADHLTKNGIAVLRFDDRGVGKSQGNHAIATSADFATDVTAAAQFLASRDDIDKNKIGLIGHSEGGLIAPMVIAQHPDLIAFFVSLAGTGMRGDQVLLPQLKRSAQLSGVTEEVVLWEEKVMTDLFKKINQSADLSNESLQTELLTIIRSYTSSATPAQRAKYPEESHAIIARQFSSNWMRFFLTHDPTSDLKKVTVPTLLLNGTLDYQVIASLNLPALEKNITSNGNKDVTVVELDQLNHLFQTAKTGSGDEYGMLDETFAPVALETISEWINARF